MIFTENQPPKADQGTVSRTEDTPLHPETQGPPPAYSAAGANQNTPMIMNYSFHPPPRESAERRFWKAFFVAVLVWILAGALLRSVVDLANAGRHRHWVGIALVCYTFVFLIILILNYPGFPQWRHCKGLA